jgi:PilZ domain
LFVAEADHAPAPKDARSSPRALVRRSGWFVGAIGQQLRECTVWDESQTGARLVVDAPETIPDIFHMYMTLDFTSRRRCRVVWRSSNQIGVEFL